MNGIKMHVDIMNNIFIGNYRVKIVINGPVIGCFFNDSMTKIYGMKLLYKFIKYVVIK